ncbi:hypothetical protein GALMADRAFT_147561 [Galerina marginata CBS 339.88]|uniref:Uncharacterized protein n=1 Tax=Galerina marginata (strain CBS 339.88) TaxID=685588 RepID=A0A067S7S4_GALM3|nr:hypothetical protein GALMADRAFT_147561 [Galerina marginata CBS 339.88]
MPSSCPGGNKYDIRRQVGVFVEEAMVEDFYWIEFGVRGKTYLRSLDADFSSNSYSCPESDSYESCDFPLSNAHLPSLTHSNFSTQNRPTPPPAPTSLDSSYLPHALGAFGSLHPRSSDLREPGRSVVPVYHARQQSREDKVVMRVVRVADVEVNTSCACVKAAAVVAVDSPWP